MWQGRFYRAVALLGGLLLLFLVGLIFVEVLFRYALHSPIRGGQDIAQIAAGALVVSGMGYCAWTGGHVSVDLVDSIRSTAFHAIILRIRQAIMIFVTAILAYAASLKTISAFRSGEATNLIGLQYWPVYGLIALGMAATLAVVVTQIFTGREVQSEENL